MSFGTGPYGITGLGVAIVDPPSAARTTVHSSRKITDEGRYDIADDGGFAGMPTTAQRVLLAVSFGVARPNFIEPRAMRQLEADVRTALASMTKGPTPSIQLLSVIAVDDGKQTLTTTIVFRDIETGTTEEVTY